MEPISGLEQLKVLVDLAKFEATTVNTLWNFYITVALAISSWFAAAGKDRLALLMPWSRGVICAGFAAFTLISLLSLAQNYGTLAAVLGDTERAMAMAMPGAEATREAMQPTVLYRLGRYVLTVSMVIELVVSLMVGALILRFGRVDAESGSR